MNLSKEKKYKYKFFKAVLDKNYDNLDTYSQKYLEYCSDTDVKNMFNKNNKLYGGSLNDEHKYNLFKAILDKNYKKLPKYALKYAKHTKDRDVKNMFGGDVNSIISNIIVKSEEMNLLKENKKIIEFYITDLNNIKSDIDLLYNTLVADTSVKDNKIKLYNNYFDKINNVINNLEYINYKLISYPSNDITTLLTQLNDKILVVHRLLLDDDTNIKTSYTDNTIDNDAFKTAVDALVNTRITQYNTDYIALINDLALMIPTDANINNATDEIDTDVKALVQIEQELADETRAKDAANTAKGLAESEKARLESVINSLKLDLVAARVDPTLATEIIKLRKELVAAESTVTLKDSEISILKKKLDDERKTKTIPPPTSVTPKPQVYAILSGHDNPHNYFNKNESTAIKNKYSNIVIGY